MITTSDLKQVTISLTRNCNLSCVWCFKDAKRRWPDLLSRQDVFDLLERISSFAHGVTFTGGEPFVRRDMGEILLKALSLPLSEIAVTTNALAVKRELEPLLRNDRIVLGVSVDGAEERHDSVRGRGTFAATLQRVRRLADLGVNLVLVMTVSKRNVEDIDTLLRLLPTLGVIGISFQRFRCMGRGEHFADERLSSGELRTVAEKIEAAKGTVGDVFVDFKDPMRNLLSDEFKTRYAPLARAAICGGCHAGVSYIYVCDDGTIQPCAFLGIKLGNVRTDDLGEVWESSELLRNLRTRARYKVCGQCRFWHLCRGCRADAYVATGDYLAGDPLCWNAAVVEQHGVTRA